MNSKLQKWLRWYGILHGEIQDLVVAKYTFQEVQKIVRSNTDLHLNSSYYDYLSRTYVSHVIIGIRRQLKIDQNSISIARLFQEMISMPETFQRRYYTDKYKGSAVENFADKDFDKFANSSLLHIDPNLVKLDFSRLQTASKRCEDFADKRVAHRDTREPKEPLTFGEVDACIDILDELYVKYYLLFHASSMDTLLPTWQYDWQAIFYVPWIKKNGNY